MVFMMTLLAAWLAWRLVKTRIRLKQAEQMNAWFIEPDMEKII